MFKRLFTIALILGATNAFAAPTSDSSSSAQMDQNLLSSTMVTRGIKVGLVKSFMDLSAEVKMLGETEKDDVKFDQKIGLVVGYAQIPVGSLGVNATLGYDTYEIGDDNEDAATVRGEASLTYGLNQNFFLQGGLNIQRITKGLEGMEKELKDEIATGYGLQIGAGAQITKNLGADLVYIYTKHSAEARIVGSGFNEEINMNLDIEGFKLSVTGTF